MDGFFKHSRDLLQRTATDKRLTAADRQVLDVAMLNTRNPGDLVELGIGSIMAGSGLARRTVIRARHHLVDLQYLIPDSNAKRGPSCFTVAMGATNDTLRGASGDTPEQTSRGATDDTFRVPNLALLGATDDTPPLHIKETGNMEMVFSSPAKFKTNIQIEPSKVKKDASNTVQKGGKSKGQSGLTPHPVLLEWNEERNAAGLDPSTIGSRNNSFAAKLQEVVPDTHLRRKVLKAFFARKDDKWLVDEGFVFYQLMNHRFDQCISAARKLDSGATAHSVPSGSTGEAARRMALLRQV